MNDTAPKAEKPMQAKKSYALRVGASAEEEGQ